MRQWAWAWGFGVAHGLITTRVFSLSCYFLCCVLAESWSGVAMASQLMTQWKMGPCAMPSSLATAGPVTEKLFEKSRIR